MDGLFAERSEEGVEVVVWGKEDEGWGRERASFRWRPERIAWWNLRRLGKIRLSVKHG